MPDLSYNFSLSCYRLSIVQFHHLLSAWGVHCGAGEWSDFPFVPLLENSLGILIAEKFSRKVIEEQSNKVIFGRREIFQKPSFLSSLQHCFSSPVNFLAPLDSFQTLQATTTRTALFWVAVPAVTAAEVSGIYLFLLGMFLLPLPCWLCCITSDAGVMQQPRLSSV